MRKILDKMFCNKKLSILLPIIVAMVTYVLLILFGNSNNKLDTLLALPIISVFWFFGVYFIVLIQVKNTSCPEWFLNLFEFFLITVLGINAIVSAVKLVMGGFKDLDFSLCIGLITFSAVSWAHSKRKN